MGGSVQPAEEQKAPLRAFLLYFLRLARSDLAALSQVRGYGVASFLHSRFTWSSDGNDFSEAPYARVARANKQWSWEYRYQNPTTGKRKSIFLSTKKFPTQVRSNGIWRLQGNYSCPVRAAWLVAVEFILCSNHLFSELTRNLQRFCA
jgi:hypothetical protein